MNIISGRKLMKKKISTMEMKMRKRINQIQEIPIKIYEV